MTLEDLLYMKTYGNSDNSVIQQICIEYLLRAFILHGSRTEQAAVGRRNMEEESASV